MKKKLSLLLAVLIVVVPVLTAVPTAAAGTAAAKLSDPAYYLSGDVDFDGLVTIMDVTMIQYVFANMKADPYGAIATVGNTRPDDDFDITDATNIQRWMVGVPMYRTVKVEIHNIEMSLPETKTYSAPTPTTTETETGIKISWNKVAGAQMYRVFKKIYQNRNEVWHSLGDTSELSFTDNMVFPRNQYTYAVRCVTADHQMFVSKLSGTSTCKCTNVPVSTYVFPTMPGEAPTAAPTEAPTEAPTVAPTQPSTDSPLTPSPEYITPSVSVYDGKLTASWSPVAGATKYVVKLRMPAISEPDIETKTVTGTSVTMNYTFNKYDSGFTVETSVVAYKNNTALTKAKAVSTKLVYKKLDSQSNDRVRAVFTMNYDIDFCNNCGQWMPRAYGGHSGRLSTVAPYETDLDLQTWHRITNTTGCPAGSYRCWRVNWPSGLMNYEIDDGIKTYYNYGYWSLVDSNWKEDYYPTITPAVNIDSIKKVDFKKDIHPQQLNNIESERGEIQSLPLMQADGALEIKFTPKDKSIRIYDIWVKTTNAKSVNKLTLLREPGDSKNDVPMYNKFGDRWTYDEKLDDNGWAVIGQIFIEDGKYTSYSFWVSERTGTFINKTVKTNDFSTLTYTLPNWYGNEYNSRYDWNMLDNNTKYEFAIQPRLDRRGEYYGDGDDDTVPAAPRGASKSYTWTGRDYEYYTENNAYFQGASLRNSNITSKPIECYAEQRNLDWTTWGEFELYMMGHDDRTGKDYIRPACSAGGKKIIGLCNNYKIPIRADVDHTGSFLEWQGYCDNGVYELTTRNAVYRHDSTHYEGTTTTWTIASHGLYARTSMYDIWSHRNEYGKHITLTDHDVDYYDPLCYEYTLDGKQYYYYEEISDKWVKKRPENYVPATPDPNAVRKPTDEHLWESELKKK